VAACKTLRVMNALRAFDVGLPLTAEQYEGLTPPVVVDRLLSRHQHRLALFLCDYLGLRGHRGRDKVRVPWTSR
jgi:vacuolar protein sorting-associated protein 16